MENKEKSVKNISKNTKREKRMKILVKFFGSEYIKQVKELEDWFKIVFDMWKICWINDNCFITKVVNGEKDNLFDISQYLDKGSDDTITLSDKSKLTWTANWKSVEF